MHVQSCCAAAELCQTCAATCVRAVLYVCVRATSARLCARADREEHGRVTLCYAYEQPTPVRHRSSLPL